MSEPYKEGYDTGFNFTGGANPYPENTPEWFEWNEGDQDGYEDREIMYDDTLELSDAYLDDLY